MTQPPASGRRLPVIAPREPPAHDLRPHREVIPVDEGAEVEIQMGHMCNNRCRFCVSGQMTEQRRAGPQDAHPVLEALRHARGRGAKRVTLLGGEPTLQPAFIPALQEAVGLGFEEIVIFTNGVKTARRAFCEEVVALGDFLWRFSIQGGNETAHDQVTEKPGSFARLMAGVRHLGELGQRMTANACINEYSYRSAPDYVDIVRDHGLEQLHLDIIRPSDAGERTDEHLRDIMARYSDMAPYFETMLERFEGLDPDFDVNLGNFPYCLLPAWTHKIHHDGRATATVSADGEGLSKEWNKYEDKKFDKLHPPACEQCVFKPQCSGVFTKYLQFYGDEEFVPVTRERLAELDPKLRAFGHHIEPVLERLGRLELPQGWSFGEQVYDDREFRLRWQLRHGDEELWLHVVHLERLRDPKQALFIGPRFAAQLGNMSPGARRLAPVLLRWLRGALQHLETPGRGKAQARGAAKSPVPVPRDLTVPEPDSKTARTVFSASLRHLLLGLRKLPAPRGATPGQIREWGSFGQQLARLTKTQPGALASVFRWTHVSTLARCVLRGHKADPATAGHFATLTLFELWALGALDQTLRIENFPSRIVSLPRRSAWTVPEGCAALRFEADALVFEGSDGGSLHRMTRQAWLSGDDELAEVCAHEIRDGITLVLEDDNPIAHWEAHPDKLGNALELGGHSAEDWVKSIGDALELIETHMPTLYEEMKLFVQRIVPVGFHDKQHLSASYAEAIGTVYMSLHPQRMVMAEALIHEFSHNKLNALVEVDKVLVNAFTSLHSSPVRPDPRPLHGVLLAAHAFLPVATLYERMLDADHPRAQSGDFRRRLAKIVSSNHEATSVVLESGRPTPIGQGLLDELGRIDSHFVERYYDEAVDAADLG